MLTKDILGNKDMKKEEVEERLNYDNDIFFKFALGTEDEDAAFIRNTIIERVTGIHPKESTVLNPNLDGIGHPCEGQQRKRIRNRNADHLFKEIRVEAL